MTSPLASGRDADVFALDGGRVLRRYRDGGDTAAEVTLMRHVGARGYPVPHVYSAGGPDMVMDHVDGPTMLEALLAQQLSAVEAGTALADLHNRLHGLPPLHSTEPGHTVLHLDLHPANIILADDGPLVIDWRNGRDGPAGLDCAMTAVILAQAALVSPDIREPATLMLRAFTSATHHPATPHLDAALTARAADSALTPHEVAVLPRARELILDTQPKTAS